ncbi:MAG: glycosyl transferase [Bacteroidetes bacterium]|nr:MAG: glycosyl transferase [Bacteroidota bacterium]
MKISIITATYNSQATIADTLRSVANQDYPNVEHIIVDGASTDDTVKTVNSFPHVSHCISEKDRGLYDAINKGIQMTTGDVIGILNSDDFFPNNEVLSKIANAFAEYKVDAIYGNIAFVKPENLSRIVRLYSSRRFNTGKFAYGYMPAHPSFYVRKSCYDQFGVYQIDYKIAADYELLMRFMHRYGVSHKYIDEIIVYMRTGGVSNKNLGSRYILNKEIIRACKENGVSTNMAILSLKYMRKIFEYINPRLKAVGK